MSVYAESSAVLAWLLDDAAGTFVRQTLSATDIVLASDLTLIECDRVLHRAAALGELSEAEVADRRAHLATAAAHWHVCCASHPRSWTGRGARSRVTRSGPSMPFTWPRFSSHARRSPDSNSSASMPAYGTSGRSSA